LKTALSKIPKKYYIVALALLPAYIYGQDLLSTQSTTYPAIINQITVNFVILLYLVGVQVSIYTKGMSKAKGWIIWAVVMVALILVFKYIGGMQTAW